MPPDTLRIVVVRQPGARPVRALYAARSATTTQVRHDHARCRRGQNGSWPAFPANRNLFHQPASPISRNLAAAPKVVSVFRPSVKDVSEQLLRNVRRNFEKARGLRCRRCTTIPHTWRCTEPTRRGTGAARCLAGGRGGPQRRAASRGARQPGASDGRRAPRRAVALRRA
jgi:hypothetical protein